MIYDNPDDGELRAADLIALFDPAVIGWHQVVVDNTKTVGSTLRVYEVVDIPVDSTDEAGLERWRDRIAKARKP